MTENILKAELKTALDRMQPKTIQQLHDTFRYWLHIEDLDLIDTALAAVLDRKVSGDPVWLMLVAASGGMKTEILRSTFNVPWVLEVDNLTSRAIVTGRTVGDKMEAITGLAKEANEKVVVIKDFSEILAKERCERGEIISQFRTWYDGSVARRYGSQDKVVRVQSTIGLIVGVTPAIDLFTAVLGILGERFLKFRFKQDRKNSRQGAVKLVGKEREMRQQLACAVKYYLENLPLDIMPTVPQPILDAMGSLAELTALCRTTVPRGLGESGAICEIEPEYATRLSKQMLKMAQLLALVRQKKEVTLEEYAVIARIAEDTCIPYRLAILRAIHGNKLTGSEIARKTGIPKATCYRSLDDLEVLGYADYEEAALESGTARLYGLTSLVTDALKAVYEPDGEGQLTRLRTPNMLEPGPLVPICIGSVNTSLDSDTPCRNPWTTSPPTTPASEAPQSRASTPTEPNKPILGRSASQ